MASNRDQSEMDKLQQMGTNLSPQQCAYYLGESAGNRLVARSRAGAEALFFVLRDADGA
ncbi:MAG: hypothetical protein K0Q83_4022 [Deltaproteobacteria bacterium]|nr:hypothetical protein [Deltaproteobacteria bacterium]